LKNSSRKWFFNEPWFERFFVEPKMGPQKPFVEGSLKNALRKWFFEESLFERFFEEPNMVP